MKTKQYLFLATLLTSLAAWPAGATDLGDPAPPLKVAEWVKGTPVDLAAGRGKGIYVVEFWATWCGPCRVSIPHLTEMQKKFKDQGVVFVGISDEQSETVKPFVERMAEKMDYTVAIDDRRQTAKGYMEAFGVGGIPHAFVVDKSGALAWHGHPMAGLDRVLEQMIAGKFDLAAAKKAAKAEQLVGEYFALADRSGDSPKAAELGDKIVTDGAGNAGLLNGFAWRLLTDPRLKNRDLKLATRAAKAALDACEGKDAATVDTYARALFDTGKVEEAIKYQKQALALAKDPRLKTELGNALKRYEAAAAAK
jgi:thiol-disulfide isomerase/thioredoxin